MDYRYDHLSREVMMGDASFGDSGRPGTMMPHFDLPTVDGGRAQRTDTMGQRPLLMTFGSVT